MTHIKDRSWGADTQIVSLVVHVPEAWSTDDAEMVGCWAISRSWGPPQERKDGLVTSASLSQISCFPVSHLSMQGSPTPFLAPTPPHLPFPTPYTCTTGACPLRYDVTRRPSLEAGRK